MGEIKVTVPDGKKAECKDLNGVTVLTLVDADNNQQSEYVPDPRPVTERIKTFEDACDDLNRRAQAGDKLANDLMTDLQFNSPRTPDLLAYIQLRIITYYEYSEDCRDTTGDFTRVPQPAVEIDRIY